MSIPLIRFYLQSTAMQEPSTLKPSYFKNVAILDKAMLAVGLRVGSFLQHFNIKAQCSSFVMSDGRVCIASGFFIRYCSNSVSFMSRLLQGFSPVKTCAVISEYFSWGKQGVTGTKTYLKKYRAKRVHIRPYVGLEGSTSLRVADDLFCSFPPDMSMQSSC